MREKNEELQKQFSEETGLITSSESTFLLVVHHLRELISSYRRSIEFIEDMIRHQLISAIGKVVTGTDFTKYMVYHNRKIMSPEFEPVPFCYAIRRPEHYPEGSLSIDVQYPAESCSQSIVTHVRHFQPEYPTQFALDASTKISVFGQRFIHGRMCHKSSDSPDLQLSLNARARQFSSFIVLVGNIASNT